MKTPVLLQLLVLLIATLLSIAAAADARLLRSEAEGSGSDASADSGTTKSEAHEAKTESPSTVSFTGPLIAGALAIVLIGAVVKFRTRQAASA